MSIFKFYFIFYVLYDNIIIIMIINDKKDAINKIKEMKLNHFPMDIFDVNNLDGIKNFFESG